MFSLDFIIIWMSETGMGRMWFMPIIFMAFCIIMFLIFRGNKKGMGPFSQGQNHQDNSYSDANNSALDIAKTRYAKGEINKEEFDQMKKDLS